MSPLDITIGMFADICRKSDQKEWWGFIRVVWHLRSPKPIRSPDSFNSTRRLSPSDSIRRPSCCSGSIRRLSCRSGSNRWSSRYSDSTKRFAYLKWHFLGPLGIKVYRRLRQKRRRKYESFHWSNNPSSTVTAISETPSQVSGLQDGFFQYYRFRSRDCSSWEAISHTWRPYSSAIDWPCRELWEAFKRASDQTVEKRLCGSKRGFERLLYMRT